MAKTKFTADVIVKPIHNSWTNKTSYKAFLNTDYKIVVDINREFSTKRQALNAIYQELKRADERMNILWKKFDNIM